MAAKQKEKGKAAAAKKPEVKSSMQFIREAVTKNPDIAFEGLVAMVKKAGYETKESSAKQEYLKNLEADRQEAQEARRKEGRGKGQGGWCKSRSDKQTERNRRSRRKRILQRAYHRGGGITKMCGKRIRLIEPKKPGQRPVSPEDDDMEKLGRALSKAGFKTRPVMMIGEDGVERMAMMGYPTKRE